MEEVISIKVVGFIWCVMGGLAIIFGSVTLVNVILGSFLYDSSTYSFLITYQSTGVAEGGLQFAAGLVGILNYNKPERAKVCYFCGVAVMLINIVTLVILIIARNCNILLSLMSIVLSVIYMRGASKNIGDIEFLTDTFEE